MKLILPFLLLCAACSLFTAEVAKITFSDQTVEMSIPNHEGWNKITEGMSPADVEALIGKPIRESSGVPSSTLTVWKIYGEVKFTAATMPATYTFMVFFDDTGVSRVAKPYGDHSTYSKELPKPEICNAQHMVYDHYPRFVDIRWMPVLTGEKISYEVEIESLSGGSNAAWKKYGHSTFTTEPYAVKTFVGANKGRYRLRAISPTANGPWSDYVQFSFKR